MKKSKLKELQEALDLTKKFPGYFDKRIFRFAIGFMIMFTLILIFYEGRINFVYASCPDNSKEDCVNPFYICNAQEEKNPLLTYDCVPIEQLPKQIKELCLKNNTCEQRFLVPGQTIGDKPSFFVLNYNFICLLIVALAFLLNHLYYKFMKWK
jgi:hypothetical protein